MAASHPDDSARPSDVPGIQFSKLDANLAIRLCEAAISADKKTMRLRYQLGRALEKREDYPRARELYEQAAAGGYAAAMSNLARLYSSGNGGKKDANKARRLRERAAALGSRSAMLDLMNEASDECERKRGQRPNKHCIEVIRFATEEVNRNPRDSDAYHRRGVAYYYSSDYDRAIADYSRSLEISPSSHSYRSRGDGYFQKKQYDQAIADYSKAIEIDPKFVKALGNRGVAYEERGDHRLAISDYRNALAIDPNYSYALIGLKRLGVTPPRKK